MRRYWTHGEGTDIRLKWSACSEWVYDSRGAAKLCGVEFEPTAEERAFALAVVAEPDSDVPRLVFADWLDEQGDARGELVRVECELRGILLEWDSRVPVRHTDLSGRRDALCRQLGYDT